MQPLQDGLSSAMQRKHHCFPVLTDDRGHFLSERTPEDFFRLRDGCTNKIAQAPLAPRDVPFAGDGRSVVKSAGSIWVSTDVPEQLVDAATGGGGGHRPQQLHQMGASGGTAQQVAHFLLEARIDSRC